MTRYDDEPLAPKDNDLRSISESNLSALELVAKVEMENAKLRDEVIELREEKNNVDFLRRVAPPLGYRPDVMAAEIVKLRYEVERLQEELRQANRPVVAHPEVAHPVVEKEKG